MLGKKIKGGRREAEGKWEEGFIHTPFIIFYNQESKSTRRREGKRQEGKGKGMKANWEEREGKGEGKGKGRQGGKEGKGKREAKK